MKYLSTLILLFLLVGTSSSLAQIDLPENFSLLAEQMGVDFMAPLDAGYKDIRVYSNRHQNYEFAIRSRKEKLEIRYHLEVEDEKRPMTSLPHIRCLQMISNLASNEEEKVISALSLPDTLTAADLNADWAKVFFFEPKKDFSTRLTCQMLAMYKEGRGMVFAYFLFDKPPLALDNRLLTIRFEEWIMDNG